MCLPANWLDLRQKITEQETLRLCCGCYQCWALFLQEGVHLEPPRNRNTNRMVRVLLVLCLCWTWTTITHRFLLHMGLSMSVWGRVGLQYGFDRQSVSSVRYWKVVYCFEVGFLSFWIIMLSFHHLPSPCTQTHTHTHVSEVFAQLISPPDLSPHWYLNSRPLTHKCDYLPVMPTKR